MDKFYMILMFLFTYFPTLVLIALVPYFTRKSENFGIGTPEELYKREDLEAIRKKYRNGTFIEGIVLGAIILVSYFWFDMITAIYIFMVGLLLMLLVSFILYLSGHKRVKLLKQAENWVTHKPQMVYVDTEFRRSRTSVSPLWFVLYPVIIIGTILIGVLIYDKLPGSIPIHFDAGGTANGWAVKSAKVLFLIPVSQAFIALVMVFAYYMIVKSKQYSEVSNPKVSLEQNRKFRYYWSAFILFAGVAILLMFTFIHMTTLGLAESSLILPVTMVIPAGMLVAVILLSVKVGQGGSRLSNVEPVVDKVEKQAVRRDEDYYWKLGIIYFNPEDPALIVEKRFGVGWTLNFGRPAALIIIAGIVVILPVVLFLTMNWLAK
jgi:uncharacterized membrane protein